MKANRSIEFVKVVKKFTRIKNMETNPVKFYNLTFNRTKGMLYFL